MASLPTKRRKQIWEALHPETQVAQLAPPENYKVGNKCPPPQTQGFAAATAESTGQSKATTNRAIARAEALGDEVLDLLGDTIAPPKRTNSKPEAAALVEVLQALRANPLVAWCERMNSGATRIGTRWVKFGFTGCPDVLGQLRDGRLLGVEVKAPKGKLRPEQAFMLERIAGAGGVAFVARDCRDVLRELKGLQ